jgi:hypothetical protein
MAFGEALRQRAIRPRISIAGPPKVNEWRRTTKAVAKTKAMSRRQVLKAIRRGSMPRPLP